MGELWQMAKDIMICTDIWWPTVMCELWQMATDVMISTDIWWPSVMWVMADGNSCNDLYWHLVTNCNGVRGVEQDKKVELNPLYGWRINRIINNLYIFKDTSLAINCTGKFLPIFKDNKTTGFSARFWWR
jgi:hypothetical protein